MIARSCPMIVRSIPALPPKPITFPSQPHCNYSPNSKEQLPGHKKSHTLCHKLPKYSSCD